MSSHRLRNVPGFHWCQNPECSSGQIHDHDTDSSCMVCHKCGYLTCVSCGTLDHGNKSCDFYKYERDTCRLGDSKYTEENELSADVVAKRANLCPGCKVPIEQDGGCDEMVCRLPTEEVAFL